MRQRPLRDTGPRNFWLIFTRPFLTVLAGAVGAAIGYVATQSWPGMAIGAVLLGWLSWWYIEASGNIASRFYMPSGASTPYRNQYSQAQALIAQKKYDAAIVELQGEISAAPDRLEPYLLLARLHRDELGNLEDAAHWFRRARAEARIGSGEELMVCRELVEMYRRRMNAPARALPELARLADRFAGQPAGEWARAELEAARLEVHGRE